MFQLEWRDEAGQLLLASQNSTSIKLRDDKVSRTISMIKILPKKSDDERKISCIASNSAASETKSSQLTFKVIFKPEVKVTQTDMMGGGKPGDTLQFRCNTQANPRVANIEWFLNEQKLPDESSNILTLKVTSHDLNGAIIKCLAKNEIGVATDEIKIQLQCK